MIEPEVLEQALKNAKPDKDWHVRALDGRFKRVTLRLGGGTPKTPQRG